jgi:hypothetical protein
VKERPGTHDQSLITKIVEIAVETAASSGHGPVADEG